MSWRDVSVSVCAHMLEMVPVCDKFLKHTQVVGEARANNPKQGRLQELDGRYQAKDTH